MFNILLYVVYIPPGQPVTKYLDYCELVEEVAVQFGVFSDILICGDFDLPGAILPADLSPSNQSSPIRAIQDLADLLSLHQKNLIFKSMNVQLDLVSSSSNTLRVTEAVDPLAKVEPCHPPLLISWQAEKASQKCNEQTLYNFKKYYFNFSNVLAECKRQAASCFQEFIKRTEDSIVTDPSQFWKFCNSGKSQHGSARELYHEGVTATTPKQKSNLFARYFSSVYLQQPPVPSPSFKYESSQTWTSIQLSKDSVKEKLDSVEPAKSVGQMVYLLLFSVEPAAYLPRRSGFCLMFPY
ncbi:hypothetical protein J6590_100734 [Homalodisca vitripennis]|nr:hypothetical protein J6590_100734 [Homalodisca vitripennis]